MTTVESTVALLARRDVPGRFLRANVFTLDHKAIGKLYMVVGSLFFAFSGLLAEAIRIQLLRPANSFLTSTDYNAVYTLHGSIMVWLFIIPFVTGGIGNFLIPLMIGARDVAFPWLNAVSFWLYVLAGILMMSTFFFGPPVGGWVEYPPLSLQGAFGTNLWALAVFFIAASSTLTSVNFLTTIATLRAPGMTPMRMPLFIWSQAVTAVLSLIATTALAVAVSLLFVERVFGPPFFLPAAGGSPILWQHLFWFYSHPAVYIMILPAFGIISEILPTFSRKPLFGYRMLVFATVVIGALAFMVWAHHMFTSGLVPWLQLPFMWLTMLIAIPTGVKIFSWMATIYGGRLRFTPAMMFACAFIALFTIGGLTGIFLAAVPADIHAHGSYFVVAHFHYVIFGGAIFALIAGTYYWFPKVTGRLLNERLGKWQFWLLFVGFNGTFLPMHWLGLKGMPRRVAVYDPQYQFWNDVSSVSSFLMTAAMLLFFLNIFYSLRRGLEAGHNPWVARTLEWQTSSPPPPENFERQPIVTDGPYNFMEPLPYERIKIPAHHTSEPVGAH